MISHWTLTFNTTHLSTAEKLLAILLERIGGQATWTKSTASYPTPSIRLLATIVLNSSSWHEAVFELIEVAQSCGHSWRLLGFVHDDFSLLTTESSISGITMIECNIRQESEPKLDA
jgi:hypothetical protein